MSEKIQLTRANLKEENSKVRASRLWQSEEEKDMVAEMQHKFGVDIRDAGPRVIQGPEQHALYHVKEVSGRYHDTEHRYYRYEPEGDKAAH